MYNIKKDNILSKDQIDIINSIISKFIFNIYIENANLIYIIKSNQSESSNSPKKSPNL